MPKSGRSSGISIALFLALACANGPLFAQDTLVDPETKALQERADRLATDLDFIDNEVSGIVNNRAKFNSDLQLRSDEVQSLKTRFPQIQVETSFDTEMFVVALQKERVRNLHESAQTNYQLAELYRAKACSSYKTSLVKRDEILASPNFLQLPISERIELRRLIDAAMAEALAQSDGNPCELTAGNQTAADNLASTAAADAAASVKGY